MQILIAGIPKAGKTTLSGKLMMAKEMIYHTDDLIKTHEWSAASEEVSNWMNKEDPWIIEGVAVPRALRKWMNKHKGNPCDVLVWLDKAHLELNQGQRTMAKGCVKVMKEIMPELMQRGVKLVHNFAELAKIVLVKAEEPKIYGKSPLEDLANIKAMPQKDTKKRKKRKGLRGKKKLMITALEKHLGNISLSVEAVGIARRTHYRWLESDEQYKQEVENVPERTLDFVENKLLKNVEKGNVAAQIFYLKTKGKGRGYIERQEIEQIGDKVQKFQLVDVDNKADAKKINDDSNNTPDKNS